MPLTCADQNSGLSNFQVTNQSLPDNTTIVYGQQGYGFPVQVRRSSEIALTGPSGTLATESLRALARIQTFARTMRRARRCSASRRRARRRTTTPTRRTRRTASSPTARCPSRTTRCVMVCVISADTTGRALAHRRARLCVASNCIAGLTCADAWGAGASLFNGPMDSTEIALRIAMALDLGQTSNVTRSSS